LSWLNGEQLNEEIQKSFQEGIINMKALNDSQHQECDRIVKCAKKFIAEKFQCITSFSRLKKTTLGFEFTMACSNSDDWDCESIWVIRLDLNQKKSTVFWNFICNHMVQNEESFALVDTSEDKFFRENKRPKIDESTDTSSSSSSSSSSGSSSGDDEQDAMSISHNEEFDEEFNEVDCRGNMSHLKSRELSGIYFIIMFLYNLIQKMKVHFNSN